MQFLEDIGVILPRLELPQEVHGHRCHSCIGQRRRCERSRCRQGCRSEFSSACMSTAPAASSEASVMMEKG